MATHGNCAVEPYSGRKLMGVSGPIFDRVDAVLAGNADYAAFRAGGLGREDFVGLLESARANLVAQGVPDEDVDYAKRYPARIDGFVADAIALLRCRGVLGQGRASESVSAQAKLKQYDHAGRSTYIYPEEAALLTALVSVQRPKRVVFLGSYYGYWAAAAAPVLEGWDGKAVLVDPDPACSAIAAANFHDERMRGAVRIETSTGETFLGGAPEPFDMVVIDAELPRDHPDPGLRGKGVYASLLSAALPCLAPDAVLVCHNILLQGAAVAPVFEQILARNRTELGPFKALAQKHFPNWTEIASTEGVGVGRRAYPS
jgi:predicted O-methyltransferase YrrM